VSREVVVGKVVPVLVGIPKSSGMARGAGGGANVRGSQGMDERDVGENVARPGAQVAVKVQACLGAVAKALLVHHSSLLATKQGNRWTQQNGPTIISNVS
jgi:hypothetical protein